LWLQEYEIGKLWIDFHEHMSTFRSIVVCQDEITSLHSDTILIEGKTVSKQPDNQRIQDRKQIVQP
jgi:hypothetical protein